MLSRQEVNTMRHLANAQYWDRPAGGNTGRLFLAFGGPVYADRFSNCPLDRVLTYKNLIYLLNLQFCIYDSGPINANIRVYTAFYCHTNDTQYHSSQLGDFCTNFKVGVLCQV